MIEVFTWIQVLILLVVGILSIKAHGTKFFKTYVTGYLIVGGSLSIAMWTIYCIVEIVLYLVSLI